MHVELTGNMLAALLAVDALRQEATRKASYATYKRLTASWTQGDMVPQTDYAKTELGGFAGEMTQCQGRETTVQGALPMAYQGRVKADGKPCSVKQLTTERKDTDNTPDYAERGNRDRVTCPALFCAGQRDVDGFKRDVAIAWLTRRLVYHGGYARGQAEREHGVKRTSAMHLDRGFALSAVEDVCQEAYIVYHDAKTAGQDISTRHACKYALGHHLRTERKAKKSVLLYLERERLRERLNASQLRSPLPCDALTQELLRGTEQEGTAKTGTLARAVNLSRETVRAHLRTVENKFASHWTLT